MKKKSCRNADTVPNVDSIFDDFLNSMAFDFFSSVEEMQKFIGVEECGVMDSLPVDELPDNLEVYLNREDTLVSLLREKYEAQMQKIDLSEVEKKFFSFVPDASDTLRDVVMSVSRKMTRPLLRSMECDSDEYAGLLRSLAFTDELTISFIWDVPKDITSLLKRRFQKVFSADAEESILGIRIEEKGYNPLTVYGMKNHPHTGIDKNSRFRYGFLCCDLADFLSMLAVHQQVNQYIYQLMHETTNNALYSAFHSRVFKFVCDSTSSHYQKVYPDSMALRYNEDYAAKWALPKYVKPYIYRSPHFNRLVTEGLITLLPSVPYQKIDSIMGENEACCVLSESGVSVLPYMFIMSCPVPYNEMVYRDSDGLNWGMPASIGSSKRYYSEPSYCELYKDLFMLIAEEKNGVRTVLDYYKELDGGYAKSFMLKKTYHRRCLLP